LARAVLVAREQLWLETEATEATAGHRCLELSTSQREAAAKASRRAAAGLGTSLCPDTGSVAHTTTTRAWAVLAATEAAHPGRGISVVVVVVVVVGEQRLLLVAAEQADSRMTTQWTYTGTISLSIAPIPTATARVARLAEATVRRVLPSVAEAAVVGTRAVPVALVALAATPVVVAVVAVGRTPLTTAALAALAVAPR
jgi:hypothetical protein